MAALSNRKKEEAIVHTATLDDLVASPLDEMEQLHSRRFHQGAISQSAQRALRSFVSNWIANGNLSVRMDNGCHRYFCFPEEAIGCRIPRLNFTPAS